MVGAKITQRTKIVEQLFANGHRTVLSRSAKYQVFNVPGEAETFLFVGRSGALRKGRTVTESHSLEGTVRNRIIARWDAAHAKGSK